MLLSIYSCDVEFVNITCLKVSHNYLLIRIRAYQKAPIVQYYTYNTIKTNNYIHISCTHTEKEKDT